MYRCPSVDEAFTYSGSLQPNSQCIQLKGSTTAEVTHPERTASWRPAGWQTGWRGRATPAGAPGAPPAPAHPQSPAGMQQSPTVRIMCRTHCCPRDVTTLSATGLQHTLHGVEGGEGVRATQPTTATHHEVCPSWHIHTIWLTSSSGSSAASSPLSASLTRGEMKSKRRSTWSTVATCIAAMKHHVVNLSIGSTLALWHVCNLSDRLSHLTKVPRVWVDWLRIN